MKSKLEVEASLVGKGALIALPPGDTDVQCGLLAEKAWAGGLVQCAWAVHLLREEMPTLRPCPT